jgi:hypothetical protein
MVNEMGRLIDTNQLPSPFLNPNMIVDMVTASSISSGLKGAVGYNSAGILGQKPFIAGYAGYIWNGTSTLSLSMPDACSLIFSHELAECMTDPGGQGLKVNKGNNWNLSPPEKSPNQIGDFEGNSYGSSQ